MDKAEVVIKWCPNLPRIYKPVYASYGVSTADIVEHTTCFCNCVEELCAAYKDGECKMFNTGVYLPVKNRK